MSVQDDPLVGRRFGSYVVERLLGTGGMGAVYSAIQPEIGKRVAIKFLAAELAADPATVQRFFAEARAVNLIQHENIVDIFDFRVIDGHSYFVMELLSGSSLGQLLSQAGRLPVRRTVEIGVQVAAAIHAAHAHSIYHRDLKPDNIFVTAKAGYGDFVKVLDFGIAKLSRPMGSPRDAPQTLHGTVMGTPGFMSPEQGTGGTVDGRTDIYSLGVVLYRMLAGRLPYFGDTFDKILELQLNKKPAALASLREDVSPELAALVHAMLQRDPQKRPQTMREVQDRLVPLIASSAGGPTPSGRLAPISDGWRSVPPTRLSPEAMKKRRVKKSVSPLMIALIAAGSTIGAGALITGSFLFFRAPHVAPPAPASPFAASQAPPAPRPLASAPLAPAPAHGRYKVFLETKPPGVEIRSGARLIGTTPVQLTLTGEQRFVLHKSGYRDEEILVNPEHEHLIVPMRPLSAKERRTPGVYQSPKPGEPPEEPPSDGTGLGLND